jgi:copper chaperone CopZ
MTTDSVLIVEGMNCSGCVGSFSRKALGVFGVVQVNVDLHPGEGSPVTVRHAAAVSAEVIALALTEAGYRVAIPVRGQ